ncbi:glycosyl transferase [Thermodesulfomicrobium sp. WS]|uniref:glycosyltransferase n=1 Tax=Thermodesulfomicrobium sp. WS TaxID=3004129 RepID=UPI002490DA8B|nr:glycosyltransferase [Thermodesulfomicrobium sp. WS]BDV00879.1 glycosyl transferase [Thermodesulfomicrobium sp. WS]
MPGISAMNKVSISVVTATYNAAAHLPRLIDALAAQTDADFEWVVADGASTDGTLALLEQAKARLKNVVVDSRPDFGIYDALNRAVKLAQGEYYIVLGADDVLFPDAIARYKEAAAESQADFVTAKIQIGRGITRPKGRRWEWLYGLSAYVSGHTVGTLIKKSLHDSVGYYSRRFPIAADQLFILRGVRTGATINELNFVAGVFDIGGTSGRDSLGSITELYRVQVEVSGRLILQTFLMFLRFIKHYKRLWRWCKLLAQYNYIAL